jgi:hypothetical protein
MKIDFRLVNTLDLWYKRFRGDFRESNLKSAEANKWLA